MKFLIAGLGSIGRRHLRNLIALNETDIVLLRTGHASLPELEAGAYPTESTLADALSRHKPDAVIVANPTALHMSVAIPAALAGCAVLIEKPLADNLSRVDELRAAAKNNAGKILVAFQFRFHPTIQKARELIQQGALGKILTVHAHWGEYLPQWHPWEDYRQSYAARADLGGGAIATLTHPLDYLRFIIGEIDSLNSLHGHVSPLEIDVEDVAEMSVKFVSGAIGGVHVNLVQRPPANRFEIVGTQGTLRWEGAEGILYFLKMPAAFGTYSTNPPAPLVETFSPPENFERNDMFLDEMKHFIAVARGEASPRCSLEDGIRVQQLVQMARGG